MIKKHKRSESTTNGNVKQAPVVATVDVPMSFDQLRSTLSDEIRRLQRGETSAASVNAVSNACGKFLGSVKVELDLCRFLGRQPKILGVLPDKFELKKPTAQATTAPADVQ